MREGDSVLVSIVVHGGAMSTPCRMYANRFPEVDDVVMVQVRQQHSMHGDGNETKREDGWTKEKKKTKERDENGGGVQPHQPVQTKRHTTRACIHGLDWIGLDWTP